MTEYVMDTFNVVEENWNVDEKWNKGKCLLNLGELLNI